jgi:hypothetical protein
MDHQCKMLFVSVSDPITGGLDANIGEQILKLLDAPRRK